MKIAAQKSWSIVADAKTGTAQNSIDFKVGPDKALQDAHAATQEAGLDLSKNASFDMGYQASPMVRTRLSSRQAAMSPASRGTSSM